MQVLKMTEQDIESVLKIEQENFTIPFSKEMFCDMLSNERYLYLIAKDSQILGYIGINVVFDECEIINIATSEQFKRNGVAKNLLLTTIDICKEKGITKIHLEVREGNHKAIKLYEKFGFLNQYIRKNYYTNPVENAWVMMLEV